jgi:hypothetical protein
MILVFLIINYFFTNIQVNDIISILNLIAYKFNIVVNVRNNLYKRNSPVEQS